MAVRIPIISDFNGKGIAKAKAEFAQLEGAGAKAGFALKKAFLPAVAVLGGLALAGKKAIAAGEQVATANAAIGQINRSMGLFGAETEKVTQRLVKLAEAQGRELGISNLTIKAAQAKLLTFKNLAKTANVAGGAFDRANQAALDLAAAGFGSAETNAVQLGKALQDPIKGITALARSGVTFTNEEKKKIRTLVESNRILEAQNIVLQSIEQQVGGTAKATANDTERMKEGFAQVTQQLGMALLPALEAVTNIILKFSDWARNNTGLFLGVAAAIGTMATAIIAANVGIKAYNAIGLITKGINAALGTSFTRLQASLGVVGLVLAAATTAYFLLSGRKKENTSVTDDLTNALRLEGRAQREAIAATVAANPAVGKLLEVLTKQGVSLRQLKRDLTNGRDGLDRLTGSLWEAQRTGKITNAQQTEYAFLLKSVSTELTNVKNAQSLVNGVLADTVNVSAYANINLDGLRKRLGLLKAESGPAIKKVNENVEKLRESFKTARQAAIDAIQKIRDARTEFGKTISDAVRNAVNFSQIQTAAKEAGTTFMEGLANSVAKAKIFAERLRQLMAAGLSQSAISQVAQAGADAGVEIADQLLAGGAGAIAQSNELVAASEAAAKEVGTLAGATYYNEGVVLAQQLTKGITDIISKYKIKLSSPGLTDKQLKRLQNRFAVDVGFVMSQVPALAKGGVVASPTLALIGEAGPEAVIPLDRMGQMGNVTINVNGGDPQAVVDALRRYMYQNGSVPIRTSG
jgi:hypothetical protein